MSRRLVLETSAVNSVAGFMADDPSGVVDMFDAVDQLPVEPAPPTSSAFGSTGIRRLRVGRYRVLYRVTGEEISVIHVGRRAGGGR